MHMQALTLYNLKNLNVKNLRVRNAQQIQISIEKCNNVVVSNVEITAPGDSPNTDGIHITNTENIRVSKTDIGTGHYSYIIRVYGVFMCTNYLLRLN